MRGDERRERRFSSRAPIITNRTAIGFSLTRGSFVEHDFERKKEGKMLGIL
jgi:hypothetical protein